MEMPTREAVQVLVNEIEQRIHAIHIHAFPNMKDKVFMISMGYPGVWMEHAYDALAYAACNADGLLTLKGQMKLFLDRQLPTGQLPAYVLDETIAFTKGYKTLVGYGQIQECVSFTQLCWETARLLKDEPFLAEAYEKCVKWENWMVRARMTTQSQLIETFCVFDTGHDNSARFEGFPNGTDGSAEHMPEHPLLPLLSPDVNAVFFRTRMALSEMAKALGKPAEAQMWLEKAENVKSAIRKTLYDAETDYYYDVDRNGRFRKFKSIAAMSLLQEHVLTGEDAERLYQKHFRNPNEFWSPFPFPSMALNDASFQKRRDGNDWGYYSQALTALRAFRWMDDYGHGEDFNLLLQKWVSAYANSTEMRFSQELDPVTGQLSKSSMWYSSGMLLFLNAVKRLKLA